MTVRVTRLLLVSVSLIPILELLSGVSLAQRTETTACSPFASGSPTRT